MTTTTEPQEEQREEPELAPADLVLPDESARDIIGGTRGDGCDDEFGCGMNHNEVLAATEPQAEQRRDEPENELALADLELPEESAGDVTGGTRGGCEEWGCGTNHNEVLAVTP